jgi:hypothetical protein
MIVITVPLGSATRRALRCWQVPLGSTLSRDRRRPLMSARNTIPRPALISGTRKGELTLSSAGTSRSLTYLRTVLHTSYRIWKCMP